MSVLGTAGEMKHFSRTRSKAGVNWPSSPQAAGVPTAGKPDPKLPGICITVAVQAACLRSCHCVPSC